METNNLTCPPSLSISDERRRLNEYISHYETLSYDTAEVHESHGRTRRSITRSPYVNLKFSAHGRHFHLRLKRDITTFSDRLQVVDTAEQPLAVDVSHVYEGRLVDEPHSFVHGSLIAGVFEGKIVAERDTFYVEHAKHYFPQLKKSRSRRRRRSRRSADREEDVFVVSLNDTAPFSADNYKYTVDSDNNNNDDIRNRAEDIKDKEQQENDDDDVDSDEEEIKLLGFHSVIYKDEHVEDPYAGRRTGHVSGCGITEDVQSWMDQIQNSAIENEEVEDEEQQRKKEIIDNAQGNSGNGGDGGDNSRNSRSNRKREPKLEEFSLPYQKYSKEANWNGTMLAAGGGSSSKKDEAWHRETHERVKRATRPREENRNTCSLYIQTDPLIWRHIREGISEVSRTTENVPS